jgi:hypothetical protein
MALLATVMLTFDRGASAAVDLVKSLFRTTAWMSAITAALVLFAGVSPLLFLLPLYFYSTTIGVDWIVRRVKFIDVLEATKVGRVRSGLVTLKASFDLAPVAISRLRWYVTSYGPPGGLSWLRRWKRVIQTILALFIWLAKDIPGKIAAFENRETHMGDGA